MGIPRKSFIAIAMAAGTLISSQAPEFAQQYRQRLGGAMEELRTVAQDFDNDALAASQSRKQALQSMSRSAEQLVRDRSTSMDRTITRYEALRGQSLALEKMPALARPFSVIDNPDDKIVQDAWAIFEPAVPITFAGLVWGGLGAFIGWIVGWLATRPFKRHKNRNVPSNIKIEPTREYPLL